MVHAAGPLHTAAVPAHLRVPHHMVRGFTAVMPELMQMVPNAVRVLGPAILMRINLGVLHAQMVILPIQVTVKHQSHSVKNLAVLEIIMLLMVMKYWIIYKAAGHK